MDSLIQQLTDKPILLTVALILVAAVVYALVKRLIKLALFLLVLLAVYFAYLYMTGQDFPEGVQKGQEMLEDVKDKASEFFNEHKDDIDKVKKKLTTDN
jgi:ABC-type multidrug transport system fused ATPase/permease subunit